jgi:hypothetical protein
VHVRTPAHTVGNDIAALDCTLETLGHQGDLKAPMGIMPSTRVVYFHRNELRRFCLDELRKATGPVTARDLAERVIKFEGRDPRDRRLRADMVRRVGKSLKMLRQRARRRASRDRGSSCSGKWRDLKGLPTSQSRSQTTR